MSGLLPSKWERKVRGLRDLETPSMVLVYRANPDGTRGKLLRIENPGNPKRRRGRNGQGRQG